MYKSMKGGVITPMIGKAKGDMIYPRIGKVNGTETTMANTSLPNKTRLRKRSGNDARHQSNNTVRRLKYCRC